MPPHALTAAACVPAIVYPPHTGTHTRSPAQTECADDLMLGLEFTCTSDARRFANKFAALAPKSHEHAADAHDAPSAEASDGAHTKGEVAREKARVATGKVLAATSKVVKAAVPQRIQRRATRNVFKFKNRFFGGRKEGHISEVMTVEHEGHIDMAAGGMDFSNLPPDHPLAAALAQSGMSATDLKDPAKAKEVMALMTVSETGGGSAGAGSAAASPSPSPPPTAASPTTEFDVAHDAAAGAEAHAEAGAGEWVGEGESGGHEAAAADDGWPADGVSAAAAPTAVDDGTSDTEGTRERAPSL